MNTATRLLCAFVCICGPLLLASPALSAAPVCLEPGGMGGTGAVATGGIGGTGAPADNGGVGGSGAPADEGGIGGTGIVGTITGFASICVNGVEVHFDDKAAISENGLPVSSEHLAIGQVVAVEARRSPRGLEARNIAILHAYEGPITDVATGTASMRVMGQPVRIAAGARVAEGLRIGEPVRVSGLRDARGEVVASRIDRAPELAQVSAIGAIDRAGTLQGLALSKPLAPHDEVLVRGTWDGRQLDVIQTRSDPGIPFAGRVRNALVEGLVRGQKADRIEFGGFTAYVDSATSYFGGQATDLAVDQRIRVTGVFGKGREIRAARIEFAWEQAATSIRKGSGHPGSSTEETEEHENGGSGRDGIESRERSSDGETRERIERSDDGETRLRIERREESASGDLERRERIEIRDSGDRLETRERIEIFENGVRVERIERSDRVDKPDRVERVDKAERVERPESVEQVERVERVDRSGPH